VPTSHKLLQATFLPWPADWQAIFGHTSPQPERPLILEIGFGYGQYLRYLSRQYPDADIVGLEISNICLTKAEGAIARGELPNVRVIYSRAETALYHLFTPASIAQVHINFPDPWFKNRHGHRRLIQPDTLDVLVNRLQPGATFRLATDILEYAEMSSELLAGTPTLTNLQPTPWTNSVSGRTITKYEKRASKEGRTCYYFIYQRNNQPALDIPVYKDQPMPHLILDTPLSLEAMRDAFHPEKYTEGNIHVNYMHAYIGDRVLLYEVFVDEPTIEQRVALVLFRRGESSDTGGENEYTLRLGRIGSPRPTQGMHVAVRHLGQELERLHPQARIVGKKLRT
jgi:tRNA (guanine-N7-)-methyltransferase